MQTPRFRSSIFLAIALSLTAASCSKDDPGDAKAAEAKSGGGSGDNVGGGRRGSGGGGARGGGRRMMTLTLGPTDIATVTHGPIEQGIPITGNLRPLETVEIRSRLEGDLDQVMVREGQSVSAGQLIAQFTAVEQEAAQRSAEADLSSAKTDATTAQWNYEQSQQLFKAGAIAERDLRTAEQTLSSAKARVAAAESKLRSTEKALADTRVLAPGAGVIEKRIAQPGEHIQRGTVMFTMVRNSVLELEAAVPERSASAVRVGQRVHFVADARTFDGTVTRVSPTIDPTTRSVAVFIDVPNSAGELRGGTFAAGRVVSRTLSSALIIPTSAVRQSADTNAPPFVYRIAGRTIDIAPVSLGAIDESHGIAEVRSGLSEGDRIIVGNVGTIGRGMTVEIIGNEGKGRRDQGAGGSQPEAGSERRGRRAQAADADGGAAGGGAGGGARGRGRRGGAPPAAPVP